MSNKSRKNVRVKLARQDASSTTAEIEQLLASRRFKEALKLAKVLFQREPEAAHRVLVERAYFRRFDQLLRGGMREGATQVAENLLEFGITDATILAEFAPQLPELGLGHKTAALAGRIDDPQARFMVAAKAADHAVLHPDTIGPHQHDLRIGVLAVRGALAGLDAGDEPLAWEQLRDIPRSSAFADWRLFARGLSALRKGDATQVAANWDRLDAGRAAYRIARLLRPATRADDVAAPAGDRQPVKINWPALETKVFGEPIATRLEDLAAALRKHEWRRFLSLLWPVARGLKRIDVRLAQRLTELLLSPIADAERIDESEFEPGTLLEQLMAANEPCRIDPRWNRLRALLCESDQDNDEQAAMHWKQYAEDIDSLSHLAADERRKMQALVYRHIGESYVLQSEPEDDSPFARPLPKKTVTKLRRQAVEAIDESLRRDPTARKSYDLLEKLYALWGQPEKTAATAQRLLAVFPDDLPTLQLLIEHHLRRQEPDQALPLVERVRRLKPLDQWIATNEIRCRQGLARQHALAGRWDEGRAELARAEALWPMDLNRAGLWSRKAALEFKSGQSERAEELLREGELAAAEPVVFWLSMAIESARHELGRELDGRFGELLKTGLAKKVSGKSAGQLSEALSAFVVTGIDYPGKELHIRQVVACLKRSTVGKLDRSDLIDVCQFIVLLPKEQRLFERLVRKGVKAFPESAFFLIHDAKLEFGRGPFRADQARMRRHFEKAHELLQNSQDPRELALSDTLKHHLGMVRNLPAAQPRMPFGMPSGFPEMSPEMFDMFSEMFGSLPGAAGADDGDDFDFFFGGPPRKSRSRRKRN